MPLYVYSREPPIVRNLRVTIFYEDSAPSFVILDIAIIMIENCPGSTKSFLAAMDFANLVLRFRGQIFNQ